MISDEGRTKKTTIELPRGLLDEMGMRAITEGLSLKALAARLLKTALMASFRFVRNDESLGDTLADTKAKVLFSFKISDDPEDRFELEWSIEDTKTLFVSVAEALISAGVNPEDMLNQVRSTR
jgi:hypothetical protein